MNISVNNEQKNLSTPQNLEQYLQSVAQPGQESAPAFAVALNGEFVPRSQYAQTMLNDGDALDIVSPVGGG